MVSMDALMAGTVQTPVVWFMGASVSRYSGVMQIREAHKALTII